MNMMKKNNASVFAFVGLAFVLFLAGTQSVHAQMVTDSPTEDANFIQQLAHNVAQVAQWYHDNVQKAVDAKIKVMTEWMRAHLEKHITDVKSVNDRNNANANAVANALAPMMDPSSRSACQIYQAAQNALTVNASTLSMGGAMMRAGANRPNTPAMAAQEAKNAMNDGLTPCSNSQEQDSKNFQQLGCTPKWGGAYEGADQSSEALFGGENADAGAVYGLPVPPEFKNNLSTNVYQPVPVVTQQKYMPFVAAYSYCQKLNPKRSQIPVSSQATVGTMAVLDKNNADAPRGLAYDMCMTFLAERMQYGAELTDPVFANFHTQQVKLCERHYKKHWLDNTPNPTTPGLSDYSACGTNGRSQLQTMYDLAHRDAYASYQQIYLDGASVDMKLNLEAAVTEQQQNFDALIIAERTALAAATGASNTSPSGPTGSTLNNSTK
jgi:hypothetical protein